VSKEENMLIELGESQPDNKKIQKKIVSGSNKK
jgi:hypothetical protein